MTMSSHRCAAPQRISVATVKSRAARTDLASTPGVRMATLGKHVQPRGLGSGDNGQFPLAAAAISTAGASQQWSVLSAATHSGCAVMTPSDQPRRGNGANGSILSHARGDCNKLPHKE